MILPFKPKNANLENMVVKSWLHGNVKVGDHVIHF